MAFERYLMRGKQKLRCGYTTGSCAALAAKAAARMLFTQKEVSQSQMLLPGGIPLSVPVEQPVLGEGFAACAVRKDGGDDIDATHGLLIEAKVSFTSQPELVIDGGEGVGRVTRPGLDQPVGAAAINSVPRRMIRQQVEEVCEEFGYAGGLRVEICAPGGEEIAKKTFNPVLGIQGGISILGTSGIVEPQSLQALVDTIQAEVKMHAACGEQELIFTPGNYGEEFLRQHPPLRPIPVVKISNFVGDALDFASQEGFKRVYLVGHAGKFVKLAAGIMNTHSRYADGRWEVFAAHAALAGAGREVIRKMEEAPTADGCLAILEEAGIREEVLSSMLGKMAYHTRRRADGVEVELLMFAGGNEVIAATEGAKSLFCW